MLLNDIHNFIINDTTVSLLRIWVKFTKKTYEVMTDAITKSQEYVDGIQLQYLPPQYHNQESNFVNVTSFAYTFIYICRWYIQMNKEVHTGVHLLALVT